jgi:hypothetical protein
MNEFSNALSEMDLSSFTPQVDAEAPDKSLKIARDAAVSRLCPIQDATDYWNSGKAQAESDTVLGGLALDQDSHNVDT